MNMAPGTKVYVSWYGNVLEGEVVDGEGFMGMTPVRIPLDGHHPVALFFPQHVYSSPEKLTEISEDRSKVDESLTKVDNNRSKVDSGVVPLTPEEYIAEVYVTDLVKRFKESHWDEAHNHIRVDSLDEFYQLWLQTHGGRSSQAEASVTCQSHTPKPVPAQPVPQNGTPSNTKRSHKKMRCWRCEHLDYDHINARQENRLPGEHYCGLHGMARVDPDGPQQNLDHKGGCGFTARKKNVELSLFE